MNTKNIAQSIHEEEAELQCIESCAAQGFTIQDYIEVKKETIEALKGLKRNVEQ